MQKLKLAKITALLALTFGSSVAMAGCPNITYDQLNTALRASVAAANGPSNGGLDFHMWATVVGTDGTVCQVAKTSDTGNGQWLLSRVISAQKANTALGLSTSVAGGGFALSTANLWSAVQPGGSLYGLQFSNPVDPAVAYSGNSANFGTALDPMRGRKIGGVNVFGGGLALYDAAHNLVGGIGVSGDTSCADHNVAWRVREAVAGGAFASANVPGGVANANKDNILFLGAGEAANGFKHPQCNSGNPEGIVNNSLPGITPVVLPTPLP